MAKKKSMFANIKKGALHRDLGVPEDQPIPPGKIQSAAGSSNEKLRKRAQWALNVKKIALKRKMSSKK